tara:strand:- start:880 stop:2028 length:1149 start_codon:yes stop_codon:yes gene_type:complete
MKNLKKIAYISSQDPRDRNAWSGTQSKMLLALKKEFNNIEIYGPIPQHKLIWKLVSKLNSLSIRIFSKKYNKSQNIFKALYYKFYLTRKIKLSKPDLIFAPASSMEIVFLKTKVPIIKLEDANFEQLLDYYPNYKGFSKFSIFESKFLSKLATEKSSKLIFSSDWASEFASKKYNVLKQNIHTVRFGANIDEVPSKKLILNKSFNDQVSLLFLGRDWERKGGDIAYKTLLILLEKGFDVKLIVCGCNPPYKHPRLELVPFLDKNIKKDFKIFQNILLQSQILFLPTRSECYGIVFCEAAAYGLPIVTTNTGAVSELVINNQTGFVLSYNSEPKDYANEIIKLIKSPNLLKQYSLNARRKFEEELNWNVWGKKVKNIFLQTLK